ncbi:hypothetical protein NECAME_07905 [Necator americanus]|uniref:Uncharacterized protein n=1 Tax=Necator americanus TaxID=51031 RepID=W2TLL3_NECAM|nr:hypothetical protein NECAME_07905 [Necator americanus]ETN82519.1 hypothetical protein NECAME_07905 [Necator americanus]
MEAVAELYGSYRQELETAMEGLRQRGQAFGESAPQYIEDTKSQIEPQTQEIIDAVQDTSAVSTPQRAVIEVFAWASVMVFFANVGVGFGSYIFGPIISIFIGKFGATLAAFVGIPLYAHYEIKHSGGSDVNIRLELLSLAVLQGVLTGFVIDSLYLSATPFAVLTPAIVTVSFASIAASAQGNRVTLLGGSVGAAVGVNFLIGLITGNLTFVYFLLTLTYAGIAAVTMQLVFKHIQGEAKGHVYQNVLSCSFIIAKGMFFLLFGSYNPEDVQVQQDRQSK